MKRPAADGPVGLQVAGLESISLPPSKPFFPQKVFSVPHSRPQRLSLLELVLDEESVSMVLRRMSPATGSSGDLGVSVVALIQGWSQICSRVGRSEGRRARHHLISCWHSEGGDTNNVEDEDALNSKREVDFVCAVCGCTAYDSVCMDLQYPSV